MSDECAGRRDVLVVCDYFHPKMSDERAGRRNEDGHGTRQWLPEENEDEKLMNDKAKMTH